MSALIAPADLDLDRFAADLHRDLGRLGYNDQPPKVHTLPVNTLTISADDEARVWRWHADQVITLTGRQADQWSHAGRNYRYAVRTDGTPCIVTWPVSL